MEHALWWILGITITVILALITVIYRNLVDRIKDLSVATDKGLDLKVDEASYRISHQYERELFEGMKVSIKELTDSNNADHTAIMIEIRKRNQI